MDKKLFKTHEAAKYLGVSRSSLANWVKQGEITGGATPGGHYRFTKEELDEFATRRRLNVDSEYAKSIGGDDGKKRVLIVDDDEAFHEFVRDALADFSGVVLEDAMDGLKGAMMIGSWKPDLVILDIRMPSMNGSELLRLMRENPVMKEIPVIVASAHLSDELKAELMPYHPDLFLDKPVRLTKLIAAVQKYMDLDLD